MITTYQVIDIQTKTVVSSHASRSVAKTVANRKDLAYGAVRFIVKPIVA